ncbi:MAG: transketolase, partial [Desulfobacteraceae bacterium]
NLPVIDRRRYPAAELLRHGAYVLDEPGEPPAAVLIATGSEVSVALKARELLSARGVPVRVVSMPSWELFEQASREYRNSVLPPGSIPRVAIEAGVPMGWERYASEGVFMTGFGASAPGATVMEKFGFTAERLAEKVAALLEKGAARG